VQVRIAPLLVVCARVQNSITSCCVCTGTAAVRLMCMHGSCQKHK
jgi:hypothetical protein